MSAKFIAPDKPWLIGIPSSSTCMSWLGNPRMNTEVNWPAVPVCTTDNPGTSRSASLTRWICFCSISSEVITLTVAGDSSSGISKRVAETTIGSASAAPGEDAGAGVDVASWPGQTSGANAANARTHILRALQILTNQTGLFCITIFLQLRELDLLGSRGFGGQRPPQQQAHRPALILLFAKKFLLQRPPCGRSDVAQQRGYRMRWTGQIFWLLALFRQPPESPSSRLHPRKILGDWPNWEVVSSYSSATAPDSHRIS